MSDIGRYVLLSLMGWTSIGAMETAPQQEGAEISTYQRSLLGEIVWPVGKKITKTSQKLFHKEQALVHDLPPSLRDVHLRRCNKFYHNSLKDAFDQYLAEKLKSWDEDNDEKLKEAYEKVEHLTMLAADNLTPDSYEKVIKPLIDFQELKILDLIIDSFSRQRMADDVLKYMPYLREKIEEYTTKYHVDFYEQLIEEIKSLPMLDMPEEQSRKGDLSLHDVVEIKARFAHHFIKHL